MNCCLVKEQKPPNHAISQPLAAMMTSSQHVYEVRPRKDRRGVDLISDALAARITNQYLRFTESFA